jgi:hypothetical protein
MRVPRLRWSIIVSSIVASVFVPTVVQAHWPAPGGSSLGVGSYTFEDGFEGRFGSAQRMWGSAWGDFDSNGFPDLLLNLHLRHPRFFSNAGGRLSTVQEEALSSYVDRHGCTWGEANGDARPDLYCAQGANKGKGRGPNQLLIQTPMAGLVERAAHYDVRDPLGRGRSVNWLDYDSDGDLDLFVASRLRTGHGNVLFRNDRGRFQRVGAGVGQEMHGISSSWSDWDRDGDPDLLVLQYEPHPAIAFENVRGTFKAVWMPGVSGRPWQAAAWGDFDADGWTDLNLVNETRSVVLRNHHGDLREVHGVGLTEGRMGAWFDQENDGDLDLFIVQGSRGGIHDVGTVNQPDVVVLTKKGGFNKTSPDSVRGPSSGNGDSVSIADVDMDGRQDIFVTNGYDKWKGKATLFRNRTQGGKAITLRLRFSPWNPWGYGARVRVAAGGRVLRAELTDGASFRSQSDVSSLHFGIGGAAHAGVRVMWPDGRVSCHTVDAGDIAELRPGRRCGR